VRFVQRLNANRLGNVTDLGTFLFGQERASLDVYRPILMDVQHGTCLYCPKKLTKTEKANGQVWVMEKVCNISARPGRSVLLHEEIAHSTFLTTTNHAFGPPSLKVKSFKSSRTS
jgi:hypothetical protein